MSPNSQNISKVREDSHRPLLPQPLALPLVLPLALPLLPQPLALPPVLPLALPPPKTVPRHSDHLHPKDNHPKKNLARNRCQDCLLAKHWMIYLCSRNLRARCRISKV